MKISLKDFASKKKIEVNFKERFDSFEFRGDMIDFSTEVVVSGIIAKLKRKFVLDVNVSTELELSCSRCLDRFLFPVDVLLKVIYVNKRPENKVREKEIKKEDIMVSHYDGDEIDIKDDVMGAIVLSIPMKPLCKEDCKGLCPVCGGNLNREQCNCKVDFVDPRLEKLKLLLKKEVG